MAKIQTFRMKSKDFLLAENVIDDTSYDRIQCQTKQQANQLAERLPAVRQDKSHDKRGYNTEKRPQHSHSCLLNSWFRSVLIPSLTSSVNPYLNCGMV